MNDPRVARVFLETGFGRANWSDTAEELSDSIEQMKRVIEKRYEAIGRKPGPDPKFA